VIQRAGRPAVERLDALYGRLTDALAWIAAGLLFVMVVMICTDVLLRNVDLGIGLRGLAWSNEISEQLLYLMTLLAAPWLLRQGAHIRVDIVLAALPRRLAWNFEWACDAIAFLCCVIIAFYGYQAAWKSYTDGALSIKTLVMPEWWHIAPLPLAFTLLGVEVLFRMRRLALGPRTLRNDAVSSA
jgi:TRAP-type C4-dicarboxylate transport system permease small subunit